jgi:hypothetical protein
MGDSRDYFNRAGSQPVSTSPSVSSRVAPGDKRGSAKRRKPLLSREERCAIMKKAKETMGPEALSAAAKKRVDNMGPEALSAASKKRADNMGPEARSAAAKKREDNMGPEARSAAAKKREDNMGPEARSAAAKKGIPKRLAAMGLGEDERCHSSACRGLDWWDRPLARYNTARQPVEQIQVCMRCIGLMEPEQLTRKLRKEHYCLAEFDNIFQDVCPGWCELAWDCPVPGACTLKKPDKLYLTCTSTADADSHLYFQLEIDEGWIPFPEPAGPRGEMRGRGHPGNSCRDEDQRLELIAADMGCPGVVLRVATDNPAAPMFLYQYCAGEPVKLRATPHFHKAFRILRDFLVSMASSPAPSVNLQRFFFDASMVAPVGVTSDEAPQRESAALCIQRAWRKTLRCK